MKLFDSNIYGVFNKKLSVFEECFITETRDQLLDQFISFKDIFEKHNKLDELVPFIRFPQEYDLYLIGHVWPERFDDTVDSVHQFVGCLDVLLDERRQKYESSNSK